jgi:hypothetical protein
MQIIETSKHKLHQLQAGGAKLGALCLTGLVALTGSGWYALSPRVTERDAALKIVRGKLVDSSVAAGVKMDDVFPHVKYIVLPKYLQRMTMHAAPSDNFAVRTKEKAQVFGNFEVHYTLNNQDPNFAHIFTELHCDSPEALKPFIGNFVVPSVIDTYKEVPTISVNDNLTGIGKKIAERLQKELNEAGYTYINIKAVIPSGVGLSPTANADLEQIVSEERKLTLLDAQKKVAEKEQEVAVAQSGATVAGFEALRKGGVPEKDLASMYYLQSLRVLDKLGVPGVPGPIPNTSASLVVPAK